MTPLLAWLLLAGIWGSTWLVMKTGLDALPPLTFASLRFAVAIVPLAALVRWRARPLPRTPRAWRLMVGSGLLTFALTYGLVFWGQQFVSSGLGALLFATFPLFGLVIADRWVPGEPLTVTRLVSVVVGVVGVGVLFAEQLHGSGYMAVWGGGAIVVGAFASACADVWIKVEGGQLDPVLLTLVQMASGLVPLTALAILLEGGRASVTWTPLAVGSVLYLSLVGSALAFVLLYWLIRRIDVTKTMLLTLATPLLAVLLGIVVLGERFTVWTGVGGGAILIGLSVALRNPGAGSPALTRRR